MSAFACKNQLKKLFLLFQIELMKNISTVSGGLVSLFIYVVCNPGFSVAKAQVFHVIWRQEKTVKELKPNPPLNCRTGLGDKSGFLSNLTFNKNLFPPYTNDING